MLYTFAYTTLIGISRWPTTTGAGAQQRKPHTPSVR
jgi:hypothetical protein